MRKQILALIGIAALGAASTANAAVTVNGGSTTVITTSPNVGAGGLTFNFGYADTTSGNPFLETLQWTNTLAGLYAITLSTESDGVAANDIDFFATAACATCGIFLSGGDIVGSLQLMADIDNNDINEDYRLDTPLLADGTYTLTFRGTGSGSFGGGVTFTAVPEPATWGMMLLGFGAAGYAMRRRRRPALAQMA